MGRKREEKPERTVSLRFKLPPGSEWHVTEADGVREFRDGQVVETVSADSDGLPTDSEFRAAVEAGIAEVI